jgi:hypothetical protein
MTQQTEEHHSIDSTQPNKQSIKLVASITDQCPLCPKKEYHFASLIDQNNPIPPAMAMMGAGNMDVVLFEDKVQEGPIYVFFRCQDPFCLLKHMREMVMTNYFQQQQQIRHQEMEKSRILQKMQSKARQPSRAANKRNKARMKSRAKVQSVESSDQ